ncbi:hypothetical protein BDF19DRAFT_324437 [Syncephalis fuscata]|nr:hypothetical protein BDF19DRAFT_324437 [Syncephalis fuscata]
MSPKKIELPAEISADTPVTFTAQQVLELTQSYVSIAENSTRIANILSQTAGIPEKLISAAIAGSEAAASGETDAKKRKRERDPDAPKRPPSSFLLFMADRRPLIKQENPDMTYTDLMKEIGTLWKALPSAQREAYETQYNSSKEAFMKLQEDYLAKKGISPMDITVATPAATGKKAKADSKSAASGEGAQKAEVAASKAKASKQKAAPAPAPVASDSDDASESDTNNTPDSASGSDSSETETEVSKSKKAALFTPPPVAAKKAKKPAKPSGEKKEGKESKKASKPSGDAAAVKKPKKQKKVVKA